MKRAGELDRAIDDDLLMEWDTEFRHVGAAQRRPGLMLHHSQDGRGGDTGATHPSCRAERWLLGGARTGEMVPPNVRHRGIGVDGKDHRAHQMSDGRGPSWSGRSESSSTRAGSTNRSRVGEGRRVEAHVDSGDGTDATWKGRIGRCLRWGKARAVRAKGQHRWTSESAMTLST